MSRIVTAVLGGVLVVATIVGIIQATNSTSGDRLKPASTAPVYGTP